VSFPPFYLSIFIKLAEGNVKISLTFQTVFHKLKPSPLSLSPLGRGWKEGIREGWL
jgi:hypothetical protein